MQTKLSQVKAAYENGDYRAALRIAAKFQDLGTHKTAIKRAHESLIHPNFYPQLGFNNETLFQDGIKALSERYGFSLPSGSSSVSNCASNSGT